MIEYSIEHAKKSTLVSRIFVSTDDKEIADVSLKCGAEVVNRPSELSMDDSSSESALLHVIKYLKEKENFNPYLIVFLQCTSPLRRDDDIDKAITRLIDSGADSLFSAFRFNKYIWTLDNGALKSINYDYKNRWREQDFPVQFQENGSIYVIKPWVIEKLNNRLGGKIEVYEMDYFASFQIDSYEDIKLCEYLLNNSSQLERISNAQ